MAAEERIDWTECPFVAIKPGVHSGAPVLAGNRMPVNAIIDHFDYGVCIEAILRYARSRRVARRIR